jgi:3-oxoacyl-[acyl-carrier protein] reductase
MEKVVIVTGAAGGLGSEIVRGFGKTGARLVVSDLPKAQIAMENLCNEINKGPGQSFAYPADVCKYEELRGMVEEVVKMWGRIDIVVNVAGGTLGMLTKKENKLLLDHSEEEWDLVLDVNLKGSFNCIKAVAPQMIKQKDGHIILIASGQGIKPAKRTSSYAAAKAGVLGLMKAAARELGEYNIRVNAVNPGATIHKSTVPGRVNLEGYINETMLGRLSNAGDLADLLIFLSMRNNISGQILNNDSRVLF